MNIKKKTNKFMSLMLSFTMVFSGVIPAYAADASITESELEDTMLYETELETTGLEENMALNESYEEETEDNIETHDDTENRYEEVEVKYNQSSSYFVTIPKTIVLGADRKAPYSIKVEGDIVSNKQVCVVPVDGIIDTEVFDFYMEDQITGSTKDNVVAEVNQAKFYWNYEDVKTGYTENDNYIIAEGLSAGRWKGVFQLEISMRTDPSHIHNYVGEITKEPTCTEKGEKTYTCGCGDSYTEEIAAKGHSYKEEITKEPTCTEIGKKTYTCDCGDSYMEETPAKGHHYGDDDKCTECGELNPNHKHSYTESITKQATCTEAGEKTYTCKCGDSYTEVIPAKGHNYGDDDKCTECGKLNPNHKHSYTETITKEATCTEAGEKAYICKCGDSYTEVIPVTKHNYIDGTCTECGIVDPYYIAPENEYSNWSYTINNNTKTISLWYYKGSAMDVIVYANYPFNGKIYKTELISSSNAGTKYMFNKNASSSNTKITSIKFSQGVGTSYAKSMENMFYGCKSLTSLDLGGFDTSNVTNMDSMFSGCKALTSLDLSSFNTSNVTSMYGMFNGCESLESIEGLNNFDTSNVTDMQNMFYNCKALTSLDVSNFNTSNVTNMSGMFTFCTLTSLDVSNFDTSNVTNMQNMFSYCLELMNLDLSNFDTNNVTNMIGMFNNNSKLKTIYVTEGKWVTTQAKVTDMFKNCGTSEVTYK